MSENITPPNEDASSSDSSPAVLDTSGAGGPFIPTKPGPIDPPDSTGGPGGPSEPHTTPPPVEEFVIEVELGPGVENIDALLSALNSPDPTAGSTGPESAFAAVAQTHGLIEAQPVSTREEVERDQARINALRDRALESGAPESPFEQSSRLERLSRLSSYISLRFPPGTSVDAVLAQLNALPQVKRAAVLPELAPPSFPTDVMIGTSGSQVQVDPQTGIQRQWYLHRTRVPQAWQLARGADVVIADVDFGCRVTHRDLVGAIERTHNAFDRTDVLTFLDKGGHGTAVLGIAGARSNGEGIAGYAPDAKLWAIQGNTGTSPRKTDTPWSDAIRFVRETDAGERRKVLLVELQTSPLAGNSEQVGSINQAIRQAIAENCVVVVAAGNGDRRADRDDAGHPFDATGSILVGATIFDAVNRRARFSNFGPTVVVSAPGDEIRDVTCGPSADNAYRNDFGGTSGAAAKVAGAVALMLSVNRFLTHDQVRDILRATGSQIILDDPDKPIGVFLNTEAAVLEAQNRLNN